MVIEVDFGRHNGGVSWLACLKRAEANLPRQSVVVVSIDLGSENDGAGPGCRSWPTGKVFVDWCGIEFAYTLDLRRDKATPRFKLTKTCCVLRVPSV